MYVMLSNTKIFWNQISRGWVPIPLLYWKEDHIGTVRKQCSRKSQVAGENDNKAWVFMWYSCDLLAHTERHQGMQNEIRNHYSKEINCQFVNLHTHGSCPDMLQCSWKYISRGNYCFDLTTVNDIGHCTFSIFQQLKFT